MAMLERLPRKGLTLVELLVVVSIISILIALVIPAVIAARGMARKATCSSNMRQIGIALGGYESNYNIFPAGQNGKGYSFLVSILPYIEMKQIYSSINFELGSYENAHQTVRAVSIGIFGCPSDSERAPNYTSYAGSEGDGNARKMNGIFLQGYPYPLQVGYATIKDGSSNTASMSEWVVGVINENRKLADIHSYDGSRSDPTPLEQFEQDCISIGGGMKATTNGQQKGCAWTDGVSPSTTYQHVLGPNKPSCINSIGSDYPMAITVGSYHPGGINLLLADGHVSFIKDSINLSVWRAKGTRDGGEVMGAE
ncbi:DUF1559 family PulG-like putative transporter [Tautonia plasticadhaerens]|uniref:Type II secretion system protein G n=1 Tax=Tautonia plasticadhaerens TaxID=2527974 RepID=A0A518HAX1_9BACT|nr:DUF1559 domain-containing protein [Tautonia plasticadhaerens]QDV37961.1 Type II secretion system protein G precursor [Tautonia plasticadhaerens]